MTSRRLQNDQAHDVLRRFNRASQATHGHAYEAGWLSSAYLRVIMSLPCDKREAELEILERQVRDLEALQIVGALTNKS